MRHDDSGNRLDAAAQLRGQQGVGFDQENSLGAELEIGRQLLAVMGAQMDDAARRDAMLVEQRRQIEDLGIDLGDVGQHAGVDRQGMAGPARRRKIRLRQRFELVAGEAHQGIAVAFQIESQRRQAFDRLAGPAGDLDDVDPGMAQQRLGAEQDVHGVIRRVDPKILDVAGNGLRCATRRACRPAASPCRWPVGRAAWRPKSGRSPAEARLRSSVVPVAVSDGNTRVARARAMRQAIADPGIVMRRGVDHHPIRLDQSIDPLVAERRRGLSGGRVRVSSKRVTAIGDRGIKDWRCRSSLR